MAPVPNITKAGSFGGGSGPTGGPSFTMSVVPGYMVLMLSQFSNSSPTFRTPTVGGVAADSLAADYVDTLGGTNLKSHLYGIEITAAGTVTVEGGLSENFYQSNLEATLFTGASSAPVSAAAGFSLTSSAFSQTLTSASGDLAAAMLLESAGLSFTPGSGVTSTSGTNVGTVNNWALSKAGASSVTIDGTFASTPGGWGWKYSLAAGAGGGGGAVSPAPRPRASRFASLINL